MKLVYWDDAIMRQPDPMHTTGNELKALAVMLMGAPAKLLPIAQLACHSLRSMNTMSMSAGEIYWKSFCPLVSFTCILVIVTQVSGVILLMSTVSKSLCVQIPSTSL